MKILLSAFACLPGAGSEPGVGWGVVRQAGLRHDVSVLTDEHNRPFIEARLREEPMPAVEFRFLRPPGPLGSSWLRRSVTHLYYAAWQVTAFLEARRWNSEVRFDIVQHVTFVNSWMPSFMGWLGVPFIWSAGIRQTTPWLFLRHMSWRARAAEAVRNFAVNWLGCIATAVTGSRARLILSGSDRSVWRKGLPVVTFPLGGLEPEEIARLLRIPHRRAGVFRVVSIGQLKGLKGISLGILAFTRLHREFPASEYRIIGDGPELGFLKQLAEEHQCATAIQFAGARTRPQVFEELAAADVLLHPSLHEQFGYAPLEAMMAGRPVICLRAAGTRHVVSDRGGILLDPDTPDQAVQRIHEALKAMIMDPEGRRRRGEAARQWAANRWCWRETGGRLNQLYESAAKRSAGIGSGGEGGITLRSAEGIPAR